MTATAAATRTAENVSLAALDISYRQRIDAIRRRHPDNPAAEARAVGAYIALHLSALRSATPEPTSEDDLALVRAVVDGEGRAL